MNTLMNKAIRLSLSGFILLAVAGCSGSSDKNTNGDARIPSYSTDETLPSTYETDLSDTTAQVSYWQDRGQLLVQLFESSGFVEIEEDVYVQLTEIYKNECPDSLCDGDLNDVQSLGIGENALITTFPDTSSVRNQSERGTCVAFALNAAMEVLEKRNGISSSNLSEQNSYFLAKKLTGTWDEAGLVPEATVKLMTEAGSVFAGESNWPYNPYQEDCEYYNDVYPGFYCSETEAQGGGTDSRRQDPYAASADGTTIEESHQLYASIDRVRQALYRGYPVVLSLNANSDFLVGTQKNGVVSWVFKVPGCDSGICGHAVLAIGYQEGEDIQGGGYIIIKNSWGSDWGDEGYAYLTYEWLENSILDAQAIVSFQ